MSRLEFCLLSLSPPVSVREQKPQRAAGRVKWKKGLWVVSRPLPHPQCLLELEVGEGVNLNCQGDRYNFGTKEILNPWCLQGHFKSEYFLNINDRIKFDLWYPSFFLKKASFKSAPILLTQSIHLTKCDYFHEMNGAFSFRVFSLPLSSPEKKKRKWN